MLRFVLGLVLVVVSGCGPLHPLFAGGPDKGKVIDTDSQEPLSAAVVLIYWHRLAPGLGHGPSQGSWMRKGPNGRLTACSGTPGLPAYGTTKTRASSNAKDESLRAWDFALTLIRLFGGVFPSR